KAIMANAGGLIVSRRVDTGEWQGPVIMVADTLRALQGMGHFNRRHFKGLVVGVTGSNGKTTTKDMIASVLEQKYVILKTEGNFNNEIGLPLTLLKLDHTYGAAVLEMGMRGLGEIDLLAGIALPDGAVITNIGETHLERLGTVANIARAKGEILDHISTDGFAVLNGDDPLVCRQAARCRGRVVFYGTGANASVKAVNITTSQGKTVSFTAHTPAGEIQLNLPVPGRHNVQNALAAVGVGLEAGLTREQIKSGLESTRLTAMRLEVIESKRTTIINDTYNANPASTKAALQILADLGEGRRKVAILGDMYELGRRAAEGHREVGSEAAAKEVDVLITVGRLAEEIALGASTAERAPEEIISFNTNAEVKKFLEKIIRPGDMVLVKGSRGMKLEEIVDCLVKMEK
ncbi:MAG: UDP-N-acetylmuramoyl-tripeptide--D-alanyl-D-alanine ligase, partial [Eubacteriales bacterium]